MDEGLKIRIGAVIDGVQESIAKISALLKGLAGAANKTAVAFRILGTAIALTGIGALVIGLALIIKAFRSTKEAGDRMQPILIGIQRIFKGIYRALEPVFNIFLELAFKALPYVTRGLGLFFSALYGLFKFIKDSGAGIALILKGIFSFNPGLVQAGIIALKESFKDSVDAAKKAFGRYNEGLTEVTKIEQDELDKQAKAREKAQKEYERLLKRRLTAQKAAIDAEIKGSEGITKSLQQKQLQSAKLGVAIKLVGVTDPETIDELRNELSAVLSQINEDFKSGRIAAGKIDYSPILSLDEEAAKAEWLRLYQSFSKTGFEEALKLAEKAPTTITVQPSIDVLSAIGSMDALKKKTLETVDAFQNFLAPVIDTVFGALENGSSIFKAIGQSLKALVVQMGLTIAKALILAGVLSLINPGGAVLGGSFVKGFGDTFKNLLGGIFGAKQFPAFAGGGGSGGLALSGGIEVRMRGTDLVGVINRGNAQIGRIG